MARGFWQLRQRFSGGMLPFLVPMLLLPAGCALEPAPSTYRTEPLVAPRIEDYEVPGGWISLAPAAPKRMVCPHCGRANQLGEAHCAHCLRRLSLLPAWMRCPSCKPREGKEPDKDCLECQGRGWVEAPEDPESGPSTLVSD